MNVISYSLWGADPKYTVGALRNAEAAPEIYPGWRARFYVDVDSVPSGIVQQLQKLADVIPMHGGGEHAKAWRVHVLHDVQGIERVIFRDTDSRLGLRERSAVQEWEESGLYGHSIRDHPSHDIPMLGGMWGVKVDAPGFAAYISRFLKDGRFRGDPDLMTRHVWPRLRHSLMLHDEIRGGRPIPVKRRGWEFIGEIMDEHDQPNKRHRKLLRDWILSH